MHSDELHDLCSFTNIIGGKIEKKLMSRVCGTSGEKRCAFRVLVGRPKRKTLLKCIAGRKTVGCIFKKSVGRAWTNLTRDGESWRCEYGIRLLDSIECEEFIE